MLRPHSSIASRVAWQHGKRLLSRLYPKHKDGSAYSRSLCKCRGQPQFGCFILIYFRVEAYRFAMQDSTLIDLLSCRFE
jgi:hypothetical protein